MSPPNNTTNSTTTPRQHHWYAHREAGAFWGMRFTFMVLKRLGRRGVAPLVYLVVGYFFVFGSKARRASRDYLAHLERFAPHLGLRDDLDTSFRHFLHFASAILDKLQAWQGKIRLDDCDFHNYEEFSNLTGQNIGGMLIGSHLGNIEVCRALGTLSRRLKLTVLVHTKHAQNFNRLMEQAGASAVELLQVTEMGVDTAIRLQEKVSQGEWIVIVGDRIPVGGGRVSRATFLGEDADFPQGPFILASLLECPVLLLFCIKLRGRFQITIERFADRISLRRKFRDADLHTYIQRYAERLQHYCLQAPLQWFNFYLFWEHQDREHA